VRVDQLVTDALLVRGQCIAAREIEVDTELAPMRVSGSETLLARMVDNVVENAVLHNRPGGRIEIRCGPDGDRAGLVVESSGAILDAAAVGQLAQPFRRLGPERTGAANGSGLGLSIVSAIAAAHDGELELRARRQGGLLVQITLPSTASVPSLAAGPG
jgi:hypothetical protein